MTHIAPGFHDHSLPLFATAQPAPDRLGHLRARLNVPDTDSLGDADLLELILARAKPGQNARPQVERLLARFGDLGRVIAAPPARLRATVPLDDAALAELKLLEICAQRLARARLRDRPVISSWAALLDYCHTHLAHHETEQFRVLYLDRKNVLIADEVLGQGTVDHVPVYPREVLRRALDLNATALILVHNHPSGDPTPSQADIAMTEAIRQACAVLSITLHDHLVIGSGREISFRAAGLLHG